MNAPTCTIDFESKSACDLKKSGAWRYSLDPTTQILCMAFRLPTWEKGRVALWHPTFPEVDINDEGDRLSLAELFHYILGGGLVEAHNAFFERSLWTNICVPLLGWPVIQPFQWRCSAAKAAALALPRDLKLAGAALHLKIRKSDEGHLVMMKISKPRKPRKKEREDWVATHGKKKPIPLLWWETLPLFDQLWAYCKQDVLAEEALSHAIDDLSAQETQYYLLDQTINQRGFQLDLEAVKCALTLIAKETQVLNAELTELTEGVVERATQRDRMKVWLEAMGLWLPDTQAQTVQDALRSEELAPEVRRALEIVQQLGRASTSKYEAMRSWSDPRDGRVRGGLLYHGATTGRWSGKGVQPHNFVRGTIKDMEGAWDLLKTQDRELIVEQFNSVMVPLSHALRGAIVPSAGKQLYVADFASIEARVLLWMADDQDALDLFRNHEDIYLSMASDIYGFPCNKKDHPKERAVGKVATLGLGYQMGASKFAATCDTYGIEIDEEFAKQVVDTYRRRFWRVKEMWAAQEVAAIQAVERKGRTVECGRVSYVQRGWFLFCVLPSGRLLSYPSPQIQSKKMPWGDTKPCLTYMGVDTYTHKWCRQTSYGGMLVEQCDQGIARDLMAEALLRCEESKVYQPVLSVHDEMLAEAHPLLGDVQAFTALMAEVPEWAEGLPVEAEGWSGWRYRK